MNQLKNKTVLVTGGSGFIGYHTVVSLLNKGAKVIILDNHSAGDDNLIKLKELDNIEIIKNSLTDYSYICLPKVDYIIHLGALISVPESMENPYWYHKVNVSGTLKLLELANYWNIKKIVIASSCTASNPKSFYGLTKKMTEEIADFYNKNKRIDVTCLRYNNIYGERQLNKNAVIPNFIDKMIKKTPIKIEGDGEQTRDFIYVKDTAEANIMALISPHKGIYSLSSGHTISILELYKILKTLLHYNKDPIFTNARKGDIKKINIDYKEISRTVADINWIPKHDIFSGLYKTVNFYNKI